MNDQEETWPPVLDVLLGEPAGIPLDVLAGRLGWHESQVRRALADLQQADCPIDPEPAARIRIESAPLACWKDYLLWRHRETTPVVEIYSRTSSTQDVMRRMMVSLGEQVDGAVAVADAQHAGRGRLGRTWYAPPGACLLFSRASVHPNRGINSVVNRLTCLTAVAVARAIESVAGLTDRIQLKWPNDLMIDGRKLAGILVETMSSADTWAAVTGVGINVNLDVENSAGVERPTCPIASLASIGVAVDRLRLLSACIDQMDAAANPENAADLLDEWRHRSISLQHRARLFANGTPIDGQVVDLDLDAGLIVRTDDGALIHLPAATTTTRAE